LCVSYRNPNSNKRDLNSEYVLKRDGTNVVVNSACTATSGSWKSPFDGATWTAASDVDIDHMVPLKNAWVVCTHPSSWVLSPSPETLTLIPYFLQNGASTWTTTKRGQFANDISSPQLWAVTDDINHAKGDKSPDAWKPPLTSFYCTYARSWIQVKYKWALSITSAEKSALTSMLGSC
jgi:hypothetical protein